MAKLNASRALLLIALLLLGACSSVSHTKLFPGIAAERTDVDIKINNHSCWAAVTIACLGEEPWWVAATWPIHTMVYRGCARLPTDAGLRGRRPWCVVHVSEGDTRALEHETLHCRGWAHE